MDSKLHPAMTVSNIKNFIPIVLEVETAHYTTWSELFQVHCRAYEVFDHLSPKPATTAAGTNAASSSSDALWSRIDAIVLQWIYGTISTDLLHTIMKPGATAHQAWTTLEGLFKDNKNTSLENTLHIQELLSKVRVLICILITPLRPKISRLQKLSHLFDEEPTSCTISRCVNRSRESPVIVFTIESQHHDFR